MSLIDEARALEPLIRGCADQMEGDRELPPALVAAISRAGLFRMLVPRVFGGPEVDLATMIAAIEEIAQADGSTGWCVATAATLGWHGGWLQPEALAQRVFGDPYAVWANGQGGRRAIAEVVPGGYRVTGRWPFGSGSRHATWFLGTGECTVVENGRPRQRPDGQSAVLDSPLWFPAEVVEVIDTWDATGLRGTSTNDWAVTDAFMPADWAGDRADRRASPCSDGPLYRLPHRCVQSLAIASVAVGIARGALDSFEALASAKRPFGSKTLLRDSEWVQAQVGQAEAQLRAGRVFLSEAAQGLWEAAEMGEVPMEQRVLARLAATHAITLATGAVDAVFHAAGATAIRATCPLERRFRDAHATHQHLQGRPDHYRTAGQWALGLNHDVRWL
jgi:alkylation response protein AidB-like acyl-CoA dehydrogenase